MTTKPSRRDPNDIVPSHVDLMWPTLKAIKLLGGSGTNEEIFDKTVEVEKFPEEVQKVHHGGNRTKLEYRAAWARSYLKKAGAITNSERGIWSITDLGEKLSPEDIPLLNKKIGNEYNQKYSQKRKHETAEDTTFESNGDNDSEETPSWQEQLIKVLTSIKPDAFEKLCQRILRESGFAKVEVTGKSGDGGIDGVGVLKINLLSFQVFFQCKRYQGSVSSPAIRDFRGAMMGRCDKGLFITTGSFTSEARKEATRDGAPAIDLIDGDDLCLLLKKLSLGIKTQLIEEVTIDSEWFQKI